MTNKSISIFDVDKFEWRVLVRRQDNAGLVLQRSMVVFDFEFANDSAKREQNIRSE